MGLVRHDRNLVIGLVPCRCTYRHRYQKVMILIQHRQQINNKRTKNGSCLDTVMIKFTSMQLVWNDTELFLLLQLLIIQLLPAIIGIEVVLVVAMVVEVIKGKKLSTIQY